MSIPGAASPLFLATTGAAEFSIARSLRLNSVDSSSLSRTPSSASNRKTWTWSAWVKRCKTGQRDELFTVWGSDTDSQVVSIQFDSNDTLTITQISYTARVTSQVFRDPSSFYHLVVSFNTTESTANDRIKVYINGSQITDFSTTSNPGQNSDTGINGTYPHHIGRFLRNGTSTGYANIYLAEVNLIDGSALDPTSFGAFDDNGVWQAKDTAGLTFGTNGFRLKFADNSGATATTLGKDTSGNSNNFTPNNFSVTAGVGNDSLVDSPTNGTQTDSGAGGTVVGNYCILNPLDSNIGSNLTNGNLDAAGTTNWSAGHARGTFALTSGKWYWEVTKTGGNTTAQIGFCNKAFSLTNSYGTLPADSWTFNFANGTEILRPSGGGGSYFSGSAMANGDVAGIALDMDAGTAIFYKNGTAGASISLSSTKTGSTNNITELFPLVGVYNANVSFNAGQRPFTHSAPSGYKALNTANLPTPTIADGSQYFDTKLYSGNAGTNAQAGLGFSPDFLWLKRRNGANAHALFDQIRGVTKALESSNNGAEKTNDPAIGSFDSNGFTLTGSANQTNASGQSYVGWAWDGGTSTVTNNDGSIASQVRAQPSAGFSIVAWSGQSGTNTVGHGLNAAPELIILKGRTNAGAWVVGSDYIGWGNRLELNGIGAASSASADFNSTAPTSSVFTAGSNQSSGNKIAYCFAPVAGYSAMGSYQGNGSSSDGVFVSLGFRPSFLLIKNTTAGTTEYWILVDSARSPSNVVNNFLYPNDSLAEGTQYFDVDLLSNGFKLRNNAVATNASNNTYIYYAVSENPFQANGGLAR